MWVIERVDGGFAAIVRTGGRGVPGYRRGWAAGGISTQQEKAHVAQHEGQVAGSDCQGHGAMRYFGAQVLESGRRQQRRQHGDGNKRNEGWGH